MSRFFNITLPSHRVLLSLALALVWSGCGDISLPPADLVIVNGKEPESLDPAIINGQADGRIVSSLFEGLTRYNAETGQPEPGLAASWEIRDAGREYRFTLREDIHWSDGSAITAKDWLYSWRRILEPRTACEYAGILYAVTNAEAFHQGTLHDFSQVGLKIEGPRTLVVSLNNPTPYFLDICSYPTLGFVPQSAIEAHGDRWLLQPDVPTSGAFRLGFWRLNDRVRLLKNPHYWEVSQVKTEIVDLLPTSNPSTALNLYEAGTVDIVWDKELIPTELVGLLSQREDFHVTDFLGTYFLRINTQQAPFGDPRIRKALALAVDRQRIVERITGAGESLAQHLVPQGIPGYQSPAGLAYDPEQAQTLLAQAGFPQGEGLPRIEYLFNSSKLNEQIAVEIQSMWRETLGVETVLRQLEWKAYLQDQTNLRYTVSRSSWIGDYLDPQTFLEVFTSNNGNNRTGWQNGRYDQLIREANDQGELKARMARLREAELLLVEEALPIIPLYFYVSMEYYDATRIGGIFPNIRAEHPLRTIFRRSAAQPALAHQPHSPQVSGPPTP